MCYLDSDLRNYFSVFQINFTYIPLYFPLQQQINEDIIKADIVVGIFIVC
jgi:hypothetical protein